MTLTKNRQALSDYLLDFLRKEWELVPYTRGVVFDTELALYTYNVRREHILNFNLEDGIVYCRSIRKGYTKDGEYQEVRFSLDYEEFKVTNLSKFEDLIEFVSSDEMARVLLHALKELNGEV